MATAKASAFFTNSAPFPSNHQSPRRPNSHGKPSGRSLLVPLSCANNIHSGCCPSLPVYRQNNSLQFLALEKRNGTSLQQHFLSLKPSTVTQLNNPHTHLWKPSHVKSGEMEGNPSNEDVLVDEQTLQQDLEKAIKEENYVLAAKLRDDLQLLHDDSKASILAANTRFYHAFKNGDFVAMRCVWAKGDNVCCVHPGAGAISGYDLVMGSWEIVCGAEHEFPIMIDLRDVEVHVRGDIGYVTCLELVKTRGRSWGRQVATNVFERVDGQWLMCIHHASHVEM